MEIGLLTPPFGTSVFKVKSTLNDPASVGGYIFAGTMPYLIVILVVLLLISLFLPWYWESLRFAIR